MAGEEIHAEAGHAEKNKVDHYQGAVRADICGRSGGNRIWDLEGGGERKIMWDVGWMSTEFFFFFFLIFFFVTDVIYEEGCTVYKYVDLYALCTGVTFFSLFSLYSSTSSRDGGFGIPVYPFSFSLSNLILYIFLPPPPFF